MAALNRPTKATYEVHESIKVDTSDNEDHTFCGIMFPIKAKQVLPIEKIYIHSVAVRGQLGPMSVWVTNDSIQPNGNGEYNFRLVQRDWTKIYEKEHSPSQRTYETLDLRDAPIAFRPGQVRLIYIHSTLQGDEAIVYDNSYPSARRAPPPRYEDAFISVLSGRAHLSTTPFGQVAAWGWGLAWRDHREFVGQIEYGCVYKLWNPDLHITFGNQFQNAVQTMLACQRRGESPVSLLPDECLYYILNMCRWDWFQDTPDGMKMSRRLRKRRLRQRLLEQQQHRQEEMQVEQANETSATPRSRPEQRSSSQDDEEMFYDAEEEIDNDDDEDYEEEEDDEWSQEDVRNQVLEAVAGVAQRMEAGGEDDDDDDNVEFGRDADGQQEEVQQQEEEEEEDEEDESDESEWERANGYRADNNVFAYRDVSSDEEADRLSDDERTAADRQAWFRIHFARIHILRALAQGDRDDDEMVDMNF